MITIPSEERAKLQAKVDKTKAELAEVNRRIVIEEENLVNTFVKSMHAYKQ